MDNGFTQKMRRGKLVIKNAYITDYSSQPDVSQNSSFNIEDPIPTLYIQSIKQEGTRIVDYQLFTEDGNIFNPIIGNLVVVTNKKPQQIQTLLMNTMWMETILRQFMYSHQTFRKK